VGRDRSRFAELDTEVVAPHRVVAAVGPHPESPAVVLFEAMLAAMNEADPDRRILKMLAARGSHVAASTASTETTQLFTAA
jgi:hypothetical protein